MEAWEELKRALPEGARLTLRQRDEGTWEVFAQSSDHISLGFGYGQTEAEAIRALIKHLERY